MHARKEFITPLKFTSEVWFSLKERLTKYLQQEDLLHQNSDAIFVLNLESRASIWIEGEKEEEELKVTQQLKATMDQIFFKTPIQSRQFSDIVMAQIMRLMGMSENVIKEKFNNF